MGKEVISPFDRGGHGRKYMFSKEKYKARIDLLVKKQQSNEGELRASRPWGRVMG
jgi:hypothetical protein